MVPPENVFGAVETWIAVYIALAIGFTLAGLILYRRVFKLILLGNRPERFDHPVRRLMGAIPLVLGQRKVLQRVSL